MENIKPKISASDKKKMFSLKKKRDKKGITNKRKEVSDKLYSTIESFLLNNPQVIFLYQIYNAMGLNKDTFYTYCKEFDEANHMDEPIIDEIHILLAMNKSEIKEQIRHDWMNDEKRTSPSERILLYKLLSNRDELDIINDTHEKRIEANFVVNTPLNKEVDSSYEDTVKVLDELDGD